MFKKWFGTNQQDPNKMSSKQAKKGKDDGQIINYELDSINLQYFSEQGYGPRKSESQDSHIIIQRQNEKERLQQNQKNLKEIQKQTIQKDDFYFCAIYDGHGQSGKEASQAANDYISQYVEKERQKIIKVQQHSVITSMLQYAFKITEKKLKGSGIDYSSSGTCVISVLIKGQDCYVANLGDSRAVLYRQVILKNQKIQNIAIELSWDQKPTRCSEKERILKYGGKIQRLFNHQKQPVGPYRVWQDDQGPGIAITRTLGDFEAKKIGLISVPEVQHIELNHNDQFIILASDGLWDVMTSAEVVGFIIEEIEVKKTLQKDPPNNNIAKNLVRACCLRWDKLNKEKIRSTNKNTQDLQFLTQRDDVTVIIGFFQFVKETIILSSQKNIKEVKNQKRKGLDKTTKN